MEATRNLTTATQKEIEDAFIKVSFEEVRSAPGSASVDPLYDDWIDNSSAKRSAPELFGANTLKRLYPKHSLVMAPAYAGVLSFPGAYVRPVAPSELITNTLFVPLARRAGAMPGILVDQVEFGSFHVAYDKYDFIVYAIKWVSGMFMDSRQFILHEGPQGPARELLLAAGVWSQETHDEIWVFDRGFWNKNHGLWAEVQKADWKDVILDENFKVSLRKDVEGFFKSETVYKRLAIPWKRGMIMHGPPGNGKTISIKAIMKWGSENGYLPLYVKSFQSYKGEEGAMADVFDKARQLSPCVVILEDLDSLINDRNRSFFLNQLDGLEGNDGLLVIGTTNHFERLDPGLSTRPSRFDRKYLFDDPNREERTLYCKYWQKKLETNPDIDFPDSLVDEAVETTEDFSFAYLKEAFVSTLVLIATEDSGHHVDFASALKAQIKVLKKQLDKAPRGDVNSYTPCSPAGPNPPEPTSTATALAEHHQEKWNTRARALAAAAMGRPFIF